MHAGNKVFVETLIAGILLAKLAGIDVCAASHVTSVFKPLAISESGVSGQSGKGSKPDEDNGADVIGGNVVFVGKGDHLIKLRFPEGWEQLPPTVFRSLKEKFRYLLKFEGKNGATDMPDEMVAMAKTDDRALNAMIFILPAADHGTADEVKDRFLKSFTLPQDLPLNAKFNRVGDLKVTHEGKVMTGEAELTFEGATLHMVVAAVRSPLQDDSWFALIMATPKPAKKQAGIIQSLIQQLQTYSR